MGPRLSACRRARAAGRPRALRRPTRDQKPRCSRRAAGSTTPSPLRARCQRDAAGRQRAGWAELVSEADKITDKKFKVIFLIRYSLTPLLSTSKFTTTAPEFPIWIFTILQLYQSCPKEDTPLFIATTPPASAAPSTSCSLLETSAHSYTPRRAYYCFCAAVPPPQCLVKLQLRDRLSAQACRLDQAHTTPTDSGECTPLRVPGPAKRCAQGICRRSRVLPFAWL